MQVRNYLEYLKAIVTTIKTISNIATMHNRADMIVFKPPDADESAGFDFSKIICSICFSLHLEY